ncbi:MAG: peptidase S41 [Anaerolineae bacterium]|nr:peptidase S41 [Anaerolineae bacterium]
MKQNRLFLVLLLAALMASGIVSTALAQDAIPAAEIVNDEGGPVSITGAVTYTNGFFTLGVAEPLVILEDQAGFVDRDRGFLMPEASQVIGKITSDFYTSPFTYSIDLPIEPAASLRDVDQDGGEDTGVMIYAIAYWTNTWGDPYLEERDLYGGGWSGAYASTRVDPNPSAKAEIIGGTYLIYAPDDAQGFPSGFGEDGLLFTPDDPIVIVPQGYTIVSLDTDPFTFDRSRRPVIDLIEGEGAEQEDFSALSYTEAFDALIELFRETYAYTEYKGIDWDAKREEFRPLFEQAEADDDSFAYQHALRDFIWSIPDGHLSAPTDDTEFITATGGGLGMAAREIDDGRVIVNFLLEEGPAALAGIELRAELIELNGQPIDDVISATRPWSLPFSADHTLRLQQLRYMLRSEVGTDVEVTYQNPGDSEPTTVTLTSVPERISFAFSSFNAGLTGAEPPVEFRLMENGYGYVKIYSFADNDLLSIQLWERMIQYLNGAGVPGLIIDMRQNGGGSGFLADQMAAYFFNEPLLLGNAASYDESLGEFYADPDLEGQYYLPPEELRYNGAVAILVGPNCNSACEYFTYDMTLQDRAAVVGQYPTAGLGGGQTTYLMPDDIQLQYSVSRALGPDGEIIIEGTGVAPTVVIPVNEETLFAEGDPILDGAVAHLDAVTAIELVDGGEIAVGETVTGEVVERQRVRYTLTFEEDGVVSIFLTDEASALDTVLRIYDLSDQLLAENDDSDDGVTAPNSSLTELEVPGGLTVILEVGTYDDASAGSYILEVRELE